MQAGRQETVDFDGSGLTVLHLVDGVCASDEALAPLQRSEEAGFPEDLSVVSEHFPDFVSRR